jgi:UDP-2,3-diacylglucosamine pyrophosphatase LpxH
MKDYKRLVVSDTHLGSEYSKEEELLSLLQSLEYDELILAGDIIEFLRNPEFTKTTGKIINFIQTFNGPIKYIVGNHDDAFESFIDSHINGIEFLREYRFIYANRRYKIQHGDQYDTGIVKQRYLIRFVSSIQNIIERSFKVNLSKWWSLKQIKKRKLKKIYDIVQWNDDADVFIMGHTHNPEVLIWLNKDENLKTYINCGDWVDNCTYVIIENGQVRLRKWEKKIVVEDT